MIVDPHYPKLVTRRAAENLVNEVEGDLYPRDYPTWFEIDCTNVKFISIEYAREIQRLWPRSRLSGLTVESNPEISANWWHARYD